MRFVLVHSPLVGPATWRWVAESLRASGHDVVLPDLRDAALSGDPSTVVRAAGQPPSTDEVVLVAHSGAGHFLPSIADGCEAPVRALLFVDAGIPPCDGSGTAGEDFRSQLQALAHPDGTLPRWSEWWGEGVMEALVSDPNRRTEIDAELREVPLALYETAMPPPIGWCENDGAYLLFSEPYREDADRAASLGWPVIEEPGSHLDTVNRPDIAARHLVALVP